MDSPSILLNEIFTLLQSLLFLDPLSFVFGIPRIPVIILSRKTVILSLFFFFAISTAFANPTIPDTFSFCRFCRLLPNPVLYLSRYSHVLQKQQLSCQLLLFQVLQD